MLYLIVRLYHRAIPLSQSVFCYSTSYIHFTLAQLIAHFWDIFSLLTDKTIGFGLKHVSIQYPLPAMRIKKG